MAGSDHSGTSRLRRDDNNNDGTRVPRVLERMRELGRRKVAAAKTVEDAQLARARETARLNKRRQRARLKDRLAGTRNIAESDPERVMNDHDKSLKYNELFGAPEPNAGPAAPPRGNKIRRDLLKMARDARAPASARVTALRTLAEMDGHIGRLQTGSADTTEKPLSAMSRAQLESELQRLRSKLRADGTSSD